MNSSKNDRSNVARLSDANVRKEIQTIMPEPSNGKRGSQHQAEDHADGRCHDFAIPHLPEDGRVLYEKHHTWRGSETPAEFHLKAAREAEDLLAEWLRAEHGARPGEFFLWAASGDEWFEVTRADGRYRSGDLVTVDRGDSIEISYNRTHVGSRDVISHGRAYGCSATLDSDGALHIDGGGSIPPSSVLVPLYARNGNWIRFDRVEAVVHTDFDDGSMAAIHQVERGKAEPNSEVEMQTFEVAGEIAIPSGEIDWELKIVGADFIKSIADESGRDEDFVIGVVRDALSEKMPDAINDVIEGLIYEMEAKAVRVTSTPTVIELLRRVVARKLAEDKENERTYTGCP